MGRRDPRLYLFDAWHACRLARRFARGATLDGFIGDALLRSAVERQLEIVGEALARASVVAPELQSEVTDVASVIAFRNRLAHGYFQIDPSLVWDALTNDVPGLQRELARALRLRDPAVALPAEEEDDA